MADALPLVAYIFDPDFVFLSFFKHVTYLLPMVPAVLQ